MSKTLCPCDECARSRSQRARLANLVRLSGPGGTSGTDAMNAGRQRRYLIKVDPEGVLPPDERARRAHALLRADMQRLAIKSAAKRKARKTGS